MGQAYYVRSLLYRVGIQPSCRLLSAADSPCRDAPAGWGPYRDDLPVADTFFASGIEGEPNGRVSAVWVPVPSSIALALLGTQPFLAFGAAGRTSEHDGRHSPLSAQIARHRTSLAFGMPASPHRPAPPTGVRRRLGGNRSLAGRQAHSGDARLTIDTARFGTLCS